MSLRSPILMLTAVSTLVTQSGVADEMPDAWRSIQPVILAKREDKLAALNSASVIVLAQLTKEEIFTEPRQVEKPADIGGPMVPAIPLHLARISAKPLLTMKGNLAGAVDFYSWIWASGKHGGPRLFSTAPGSVHVLFLKQDSGYLHTVGDYPGYDIPIRTAWVQPFIANWADGYSRFASLIERIVAVRIKAEFESLERGDAVVPWLYTGEPAELTSWDYVASQLKGLCDRAVNPIGRAKACKEFADVSRYWRDD